MNNYEAQGGENVRRVSENDASLQGLRPFSSLHDTYEWETGIPDVRSWVVKDANGNRIGKVDDLIVDPTQHRVRYLDVDLRDSASPGDEDFHLLIPIGAAQIDEQTDEIKALNLTKEKLTNYPRYDRGEVNRAYENRLRDFFGFDQQRNNDRYQTGTKSDFNEYTEGVSRTTHLMDDMPADQGSNAQMRNVTTDQSSNTGGSNAANQQNEELSDFAQRHISRPDVRDNSSEPGTLAANDFYTNSHFDETRFYGPRHSGVRRGGITTFPEGEGRFTFRRRNI